MRSPLFLGIAFTLSALTCLASPLLKGPTSAITGQQSVFAVQGAAEPYVWKAVPPGGKDKDAREVNHNRPALVTTWQGRSGEWRVWVQGADGPSNEILVNVMSDTTGDTMLVADPTDVVAWSEEMQRKPKATKASDLAMAASVADQAVQRIIPDNPDTPVASDENGLPIVGTAADAKSVGGMISEAIEQDTPGTPIFLSPNADNVVDLAAQLIEPEMPGILRNPFVRVRSATNKPIEISVLLSAIVLGPRNYAVFNNQISAINDSVGGSLLRLHSIDREYATLRTGRFFMRIPVDVPTTIRLPN